MWKVEWYNYYNKVETFILSTEQIMRCLRYDRNYYISIEPANTNMSTIAKILLDKLTKAELKILCMSFDDGSLINVMYDEVIPVDVANHPDDYVSKTDGPIRKIDKSEFGVFREDLSVAEKQKRANSHFNRG